MDSIRAFTFSEDELEDLIYAIECALHHGQTSLARNDRLTENLKIFKKQSTGFSVQKEEMKELLSPREKEIFQILLMGKSNEEMAKYVNVSEQTIKSHVKNIYSKLNVKNKVELILTYYQP